MLTGPTARCVAAGATRARTTETKVAAPPRADGVIVEWEREGYARLAGYAEAATAWDRNGPVAYAVASAFGAFATVRVLLASVSRCGAGSRTGGQGHRVVVRAEVLNGDGTHDAAP